LFELSGLGLFPTQFEIYFGFLKTLENER